MKKDDKVVLFQAALRSLLFILVVGALAGLLKRQMILTLSVMAGSFFVIQLALHYGKAWFTKKTLGLFKFLWFKPGLTLGNLIITTLIFLVGYQAYLLGFLATIKDGWVWLTVVIAVFAVAFGQGILAALTKKTRFGHYFKTPFC